MRSVRQRVQVMSVLLTFAAGAVNVVCFVSLGGAFASVMTGNMIVLGLAVGMADATQALSAGLAFAGYVAGTVLEGLLTRRAGHRSRSPSSIPIALGIEFAALLGIVVLWWMFGGNPAPTEQRLTLTLAAAAMGLQSATVASLGIPGISTTYMTGTLTRLLIGIAGPSDRKWIDWWSLVRLVALIVGAILGAVLIRTASPTVPLVPLVAVGLTMLIAATTARRPPPSAEP